MIRLRVLLARCAALFSRRRLDDRLAEEIDNHLALSIDENRRRGMTPEEARRAARRDFGGVEQMKETWRDRRGFPGIETFFQDLRQGARNLRRAPLIWLMAVTTLAIGLGANATIFTMVRAILFRPIEMLNPDSAVIVYSLNQRQGLRRSSVSKEDFLAWRERSRSFERLVACYGTTRGFSGQGEPRRVRTDRVSSGYFEYFGLTPAAGRFPRPEESDPGRSNVIVLSYGFWTEQFARDPSVIGRPVRLDDAEYTVIGVAPPEFWFPSARVQLWTPFAARAAAVPGPRELLVLGRLRPGVSREQAQQEMTGIARQLEAETPEARSGWSVAIRTPYEGLFSDNDRTGVFLLYLLAAGVLLVACANVANLLLAHAIGRRKEMAVRAALGAGRMRLTRQCLTESLLLAVPAGVMGVLVAMWSSRVAVNSLDLPMRLPEQLVDGRVLAFTLLLAAASVLVFGMAPALEAARCDLAPTLKEGGARGGTSRRAHWLRRGFVVIQTSLALALIATAALTFKGTRAIHRLDPGFSATDLVLADLKPAVWRYADDAAVRAFFTEALRRLEAAPGVVSAGAMSGVPCLDTNGDRTAVVLEGRPEPPPAERMMGSFLLATAGGIEALGVPLERGRSIQRTDREDTGRVVVINRTAANRFWPGENPVGRRIRLDALGKQWFTVTGVIRDLLRENLVEPVQPQFFVPYAQGAERAMTLIVRTRGAQAAIPEIRRVLRELDSLEPVQVRTAEAELKRERRAGRTVVVMFGIFGALALLLAAVGLFSLITQSAGERTREVGIRLVFGAGGGDVVRLLVTEGLRLTAVGAAAGLAVSIPLGRLVASVVPVKTVDAPVLALACLALAGLTGVACYLPARRACRIDPAAVLRNE